MIKLKRAYEPATSDDGARFLVERLWPRGVKKSDLPIEAWPKDVAPSTELRQWFQHDPEKWPEFQRRYVSELRHNRAALEPLLRAAADGTITLVYGSHDTEHNNAVVLRDYLDEGHRDGSTGHGQQRSSNDPSRSAGHRQSSAGHAAGTSVHAPKRHR